MVKLSPSAPFWRPTDAVSLCISLCFVTSTPVPSPTLFMPLHCRLIVCLLCFGSKVVNYLDLLKPLNDVVIAPMQKLMLISAN